ncbi:urea ABC transporter permease subunit UrtB [Lichenicoccus sp.]|uniref:urea ABC transporter permease subunit UrtB n=1 Tax=Lichenicoccus sp. TaxID=2781899 RepID=UPI003D0E3049
MRLIWGSLAALAAVLAVSGSAEAAPLDRGGTVGLLCSGSQEAVTALHRLLDSAPTASPADAAWSMQLAHAFSDRAVRCGGTGKFLDLPAGGVDAASLAPARIPPGLPAPLPSLRARRLLSETIAALTLFVAASQDDRLAAVATLSHFQDQLPSGLLQAALHRTHDPAVRAALRALIVETGLFSPDQSRRLAAIAALGARATSRDVARLSALRADPNFAHDPRTTAAIDRALAQAHFWVRSGAVLSLLYNGLSTGSVLFLSAVGLSIVFGLMGVINLAQGELITVGAYATFCVQEALRHVAPGLLGFYPLFAVPVAFGAAALVGVAMEVTVIRHLYQRPLMTLLATWAISLLLANLVRVGFGTQNLRFDTPSWLSGGTRLVGDCLITWNHLFAIGFAVAAFAAALAVLHLTDLGLFIRAVTQNRAMAGALGVRTLRIDRVAFGLGAGLAGLAGLALSPTYNVNPTMGSGFIIDSFMVVVLGGIGSLPGTALAALGIGMVDVGIEPFYGAVAAKVVSLLLVVALIQWRPEGLVAIRGRR